MSTGYRGVQWSAGKLRYDGAVLALLLLFLVAFLGATLAVRPEITAESALLRTFGLAAMLLLHLVLMIGPLARLDRRFLPLLWNRRHLGVATFGCALVHGGFALFQFHALGDRNPLVSVLSSNARLDSLAGFPFQPLGLAALGILLLLAATSHDFWLANLTAPTWKALHLSVYLAYVLLVGHVALGALQDERAPAPAIWLGTGIVLVAVLHVAAALRERRLDRELRAATADGFVDVGRAAEIAETRARVVTLGGERVAVFRHRGSISALSNVCQHQNGPLGEGRIVDGCVTCPWHGFQYRPQDGRAPEPFTESVPTFRVRVLDGRILVDPRPLPAGTRIAPAVLDPATASPADREPFFVGYLSPPPESRRFLVATVIALATVCALVGWTLGVSQRPLGAGRFEFGVESVTEGLLRLEPVPSLWSVGESVGSSGLDLEAIPLVGFGKRGPGDEVLALAGREVRATGSWIRRGPERMLEIASVEPTGGREAAAPGVSASPLRHGRVRLRGEIVDSKCFLGVMKPAEGKSHKACAIRCISGGSPAAFVVRSDAGETAVFWLIDCDGRPLGRQLLDRVAEPVEIDGELFRFAQRDLLVADAADVRSLAGHGM